MPRPCHAHAMALHACARVHVPMRNAWTCDIEHIGHGQYYVNFKVGLQLYLSREVLKIKCSKFTRGLEPLYGDACSAKSLKVLTLVFSTDCSTIDWLQSVLKITRFENVFLFFLFLKIRRHVRGGVKLD